MYACVLKEKRDFILCKVEFLALVLKLFICLCDGDCSTQYFPNQNKNSLVEWRKTLSAVCYISTFIGIFVDI